MRLFSAILKASPYRFWEESLEGRPEEPRHNNKELVPNNRKTINKGNSRYLLGEEHGRREKTNRKKKSIARNQNYTTVFDKVNNETTQIYCPKRGKNIRKYRMNVK